MQGLYAGDRCSEPPIGSAFVVKVDLSHKSLRGLRYGAGKGEKIGVVSNWH